MARSVNMLLYAVALFFEYPKEDSLTLTLCSYRALIPLHIKYFGVIEPVC